ncbi:9067_t:CDS:1, partial [Scutellospora calospora]
FKLMHIELDLLATKHKLRDIFLDEDEFKEVDNLLNLLYPILEATILLSSCLYLTISNVYLSFDSILHYLSRFIDDRSYSLNKYMVTNSIHYKLNKYWLLLDKSITIAAILDSTSKLITFSSEEKRNTTITNLHQAIVQYILQASATNASPSKNRKREFFKSLLEQQQLINKPPVEELDLYLSSPPCSEEDPLEWWVKNEFRFPILAKIAHNYLAIQGTSVPCEEAFSVAARTLTKIRNRLHLETAYALLCLKSWMEQGIEVQIEK